MIITWALEPLLTCRHIDDIYIVAACRWREMILEDARAAGLDIWKIRDFADPGITRQRSIWNGLRMAMTHSDNVTMINGAGCPDTVLIHDAARPCLPGTLLDAIYQAFPGHDGVIPVLPMKDMVYLRSAEGGLDKPLPRERIVAGQAPELFAFGPYYWANAAFFPISADGTGEADTALQVTIDEIRGSTEPALLAGMDMVTIPGDEHNFKITTNADLSRLIRIIEENE